MVLKQKKKTIRNEEKNNFTLLALDINLETSPDNAPDPPDPPNDSLSFPFWSSPNRNYETSPKALLENTCCSTDDPSCPLLPIDSIVPSVVEESIRKNSAESVRKTPKRTLKDVSFGPSNANEESKRKHGLYDKELSPENKTQIFTSPKMRKHSLETVEAGCQSPICGSPRPKIPCPIAEISERLSDEC
ncbi:hypothetical protein Avbf_08279 [Armadillidium vulgare]|nr:hypothetical protein Avbf_08279 [Armadillidium vulgare]